MSDGGDFSGFSKVELVDANKKSYGPEKLSGKRLIGVFFAAGWCAPCKQFTPRLTKAYNELKAAGKLKDFEIVFASCDRSEEEFWRYFQDPTGKGSTSMPWLAFNYSSPWATQFGRHFAVKGVPSLLILDQNAEIISRNGREHIEKDGARALDKWMNELNRNDPPPDPSSGNYVHGVSKHRGHVKPFYPEGHRAPSHEGKHESEAQLKAEEYMYEPEGADQFQWRNTMQNGQITAAPRPTTGFTSVRAGAQSPIHTACRDGDLQMLKYLMQRKAPIMVVDQYGRTPLHYAAMHGGGLRPVEFCKELAGTEWLEMARRLDNKENTPLHYACRYGHKHIATVLLQSNNGEWMKEHRNKRGERPYDLMLMYGHQGLLDGADAHKIVPKDVAAKLAAVEVIDPDRAVRTPGSRPSSVKHEKRCNQALYAAVMSENVEEVKYLLENTPARPDASKKGVTILEEAIRIGNLAIVRLLDRKLNPELPVNIDLFGWDEDDYNTHIAGKY